MTEDSMGRIHLFELKLETMTKKQREYNRTQVTIKKYVNTLHNLFCKNYGTCEEANELLTNRQYI